MFDLPAEMSEEKKGKKKGIISKLTIITIIVSLGNTAWR